MSNGIFVISCNIYPLYLIIHVICFISPKTFSNPSYIHLSLSLSLYLLHWTKFLRSTCFLHWSEIWAFSLPLKRPLSLFSSIKAIFKVIITYYFFQYNPLNKTKQILMNKISEIFSILLVLIFAQSSERFRSIFNFHTSHSLTLFAHSSTLNFHHNFRSICCFSLFWWIFINSANFNLNVSLIFRLMWV